MPSMPAGNLSDTAARGFAQASRLGPAPYFGRFVGSLGMQTGNYSSGACFASFFPKRGFRDAAVLPVVYAGGKQRRRCAHPLGASASHEVEEGGRRAAGLRGRPPPPPPPRNPFLRGAWFPRGRGRCAALPGGRPPRPLPSPPPLAAAPFVPAPPFGAAAAPPFPAAGRGLVLLGARRCTAARPRGVLRVFAMPPPHLAAPGAPLATPTA